MIALAVSYGQLDEEGGRQKAAGGGQRTEVSRSGPPKGWPSAIGDRLFPGAIARYARFADYHIVLGERLKELTKTVNALGGADTRSLGYTDTGPILERDLAQRAGLGFIGKHTNLIRRSLGSVARQVGHVPVPAGREPTVQGSGGLRRGGRGETTRVKPQRPRPITNGLFHAHNPVGWSRNTHGTLNREERCCASAFTPNVSVA